jgi:hypothetical protein
MVVMGWSMATMMVMKRTLQVKPVVEHKTFDDEGSHLSTPASMRAPRRWRWPRWWWALITNSTIDDGIIHGGPL